VTRRRPFIKLTKTPLVGAPTLLGSSSAVAQSSSPPPLSECNERGLDLALPSPDPARFVTVSRCGCVALSNSLSWLLLKSPSRPLPVDRGYESKPLLPPLPSLVLCFWSQRRRRRGPAPSRPRPRAHVLFSCAACTTHISTLPPSNSPVVFRELRSPPPPPPLSALGSRLSALGSSPPPPSHCIITRACMSAFLLLLLVRFEVKQLTHSKR